jgi:hypothetical protein
VPSRRSSSTSPPEPGQAPTTADLAETDEVVLIEVIRAKAAELGHNPLSTRRGSLQVGQISVGADTWSSITRSRNFRRVKM